MAKTNTPFTGSGRNIEGGALAVRKQDFLSHIQGTGYLHNASDINISPILGGNNVQEALDLISDVIVASGTAFVSIGSVDGYVQGSYNVGSVDTPTLLTAFNAAFNDTRLQNGGIILLLAGTYHLQNTVIVPNGISIMGENAGTIIIGETEESPMFIVDKIHTQINLITGTAVATGSNINKVKISNLTLIDNLDGYISSNEPSMTSVPMIQARADSNLVCENVTFIGKLHSGSVSGRTKTFAGIGTTSGGILGTNLSIKDCYLDGLKIGIQFLPGAGNLDFLSVEGCKARTYGTENSGDTSVNNNSFIVTEVCNLNVSNNYHYGAGSEVSTFINFYSGTTSNVFINITGNRGSAYGVSGNIVKNSAAISFKMNLNSNNWSQHIDNPWYITVGGSDGSSPIGDIIGTTAIDVVLALSLNNSFKGTVIVNPGIYTIKGVLSANNYSNLKFIGNKNGKNYPIFNLNLSSSTLDNLSNRFIVLGNHLESIIFNSVGFKHSIKPSFNSTSSINQTTAHLLEVKDCIFINTSLYMQDLGGASSTWVDALGNPASAKIIIKECSFYQSGTFSDTISLVAPSTTHLNVEDCYFSGNGYALNIGTNGYSSVNQDFGNVLLKNNIFDLTNDTISGSNPLYYSYICLNDLNFVNIENCRFLSDRNFTASSPINSSLTFSGLFNRFVYISAVDINIDNSVFCGPVQTTSILSVDYAISTLFAEPTNSLRITNCKFMEGALLLQVSGSQVLVDGDFREGIFIDKCHFKSSANILLDLDINALNQDPFAYSSITNCNFQNNVTSYQVKHYQAIGALYNTIGIIQLYLGQCNCNFSNNFINGIISAVTGFTKYSGLYVNNYENTSGAGDISSPVIISNNIIFITNNYSLASSSASASSLNVSSSSISINNNNINFYNSASILASFAGPIYIDNRETVFTGAYSSCIINNNIITRKNYVGSSSVLSRGYILLSTNSSKNNGGFIVDNFFDYSTYNNVSNTLIEDNTQSVSNNINVGYWIIERNRNQTQSFTLNWSFGSHGISTGSNIGTVVLYGGDVTTSNIHASTTNNNSLIFAYNNTGSQDQFKWNLPLNSILPYGVTITAISYTYQASSVPTSTKTVSATLVGNDGDQTDTLTITGTSPVIRNLSLLNIYTVKNSDNLCLSIGANINSSSGVNITISDVIISYKW